MSMKVAVWVSELGFVEAQLISHCIQYIHLLNDWSLLHLQSLADWLLIHPEVTHSSLTWVNHWLSGWLSDSLFTESPRLSDSESVTRQWLSDSVSESVSQSLTDRLTEMSDCECDCEWSLQFSQWFDWLRRLTGFHVPRSGLLNTIPRHSYYCETTGWLCLPVWLCRDRRLGRVSRLLYDKVFA